MSQWLENNKRILSSFKKNNSFDLRKISGQIISQAALTRDPVLLQQSYLAYALSKLLSKPHYIEYKEWQAFKTTVEEILTQCQQDLKERNKD
ncbi:MAG: hypothetical protein GOV15_03790, partial [Candidatus Diapherotrites archaeon]|nr:hypothetical protein [Candidatus Diapherotrites archaeon]